jgi:phosphatidylglycerol:prolipoprotein diacylglycerol transferase
VHPVLLNLRAFGFQWQLHTYGLMIALGFVVAIVLGTRAAARTGEDPGQVRDLCFWLLVSSLVGARLLFLLTNLPAYVRLCREEGDCLQALRVWEGGLVFYGGFFGALVTAWWFCRRYRLRFFRIADLLAPSVAIGHFFGRLGCYAAGCCWGSASSLPWAVRFGPASVVFQDLEARGVLSVDATLTPPLHPVQLYEALGELALFLVLSLLGRRKRWDGQVLLAYLVGYSLLRLALETLRGDAARKFVVASLSTSQAIALGSLLLASALAYWTRRRIKTENVAAPGRTGSAN